jgi:hypothetical protein
VHVNAGLNINRCMYMIVVINELEIRRGEDVSYEAKMKKEKDR